MSNAATIARVGRAGFACLAGFALIILSASLVEAEFGPRTTIGVNYQQTSNTMSLDRINEGSCDGNANCNILFQPAPQQKRLIVQHVSCRVAVSPGGPMWVGLRTRKGQTFPQKNTWLVPFPTTNNVWAVNNSVMHLYESAERPHVFFQNSAAANWNMECTISGKLQQP